MAEGTTIAKVPFIDDVKFLESLQRANNSLMPYELLLEIQRNTIIHTWIEVVLIIEVFRVDTLESRLILKLLYAFILDSPDLFVIKCLLD